MTTTPRHHLQIPLSSPLNPSPHLQAKFHRPPEAPSDPSVPESKATTLAVMVNVINEVLPESLTWPMALGSAHTPHHIGDFASARAVADALALMVDGTMAVDAGEWELWITDITDISYMWYWWLGPRLSQNGPHPSFTYAIHIHTNMYIITLPPPPAAWLAENGPNPPPPRRHRRPPHIARHPQGQPRHTRSTSSPGYRGTCRRCRLRRVSRRFIDIIDS